MENTLLTLSGIQPDEGLFHGFSIDQIANMERDHPDFAQEIGIRCQHCDKNWFMGHLFLADKMGCVPCCEKWEADIIMHQQKALWESNCPKELRDTDINHEKFPLAIYRSLKGYDGTKSLLLYGPSGEGKTRTATLLLKKALLKGKSIGFLWPEELTSYAKSNFDRLKQIHALSKYDVLLMDDALLTGAQDERVASFLKDLIDVRQRHQRHTIITSQIGQTDYKEQADKFKNMTAADKERVAALLRRIEEGFETVAFITPKATEGSF